MDKYYNICIIVEGSEEYAFFDVVRQLGTHEKFCLEIENASGEVLSLIYFFLSYAMIYTIVYFVLLMSIIEHPTSDLNIVLQGKN